MPAHSLTLITPPAQEPLLLSEIKDYLRIEQSDLSRDALLYGLIVAGRQYLDGRDGILNRALITQTWDLSLPCFPCSDSIIIPLPPLQAAPTAPTVKYYNTVNVETILAATEYSVDAGSEPGRIVLNYGKYWPTTTLRPLNGVVVRFKAGYGDTAADVPEKYKLLLQILIAYLHEHPEGEVRLPLAFDSFLYSLRP
jgi:uncharacterized phiE125 gp8 family phage protein